MSLLQVRAGKNSLTAASSVRSDISAACPTLRGRVIRRSPPSTGPIWATGLSKPPFFSGVAEKPCLQSPRFEAKLTGVPRHGGVRSLSTARSSQLGMLPSGRGEACERRKARCGLRSSSCLDCSSQRSLFENGLPACDRSARRCQERARASPTAGRFRQVRRRSLPRS